MSNSKTPKDDRPNSSTQTFSVSFPAKKSNLVAVDSGALSMALNTLKRDAEDGRHARGELVEELELQCVDYDAIIAPYLDMIEYRDELIKVMSETLDKYKTLLDEVDEQLSSHGKELNELCEQCENLTKDYKEHR